MVKKESKAEKKSISVEILVGLGGLWESCVEEVVELFVGKPPLIPPNLYTQENENSSAYPVLDRKKLSGKVYFYHNGGNSAGRLGS